MRLGAECIHLLPVLAFCLTLLHSASGAERAGDVDSMPGWLGASYSVSSRKPQVSSPSSKIDYKQVIQLSAWKPRAFLHKKFLTDEECDHLIKSATPQLERSQVSDDADGSSGEQSDIRTSFGMFMDKGADPVLKGIEQRISEWTFLPLANQEALQVLRYTRGQKYEAHHDYFDDPEHKQQGGHRYATVLMYLNDVTRGGETAFPNVPDPTPKDDTWSECAKGVLAVKPRKGDALLFFSMFPDGSPDENSLHFACPVEEGIKWSAPKWIHVGDFDRPIVNGNGDPTQCIDTNAFCEEWATQGECVGNAPYMIGDASSPGACRKACHACGSGAKAT